MPLHITIPCDVGDSSSLAAASLANIISLIDRVDTQLADPSLPLPGDQAERYLWVRQTAKTLRAVKEAAEKAALLTYVNVMASEDVRGLIRDLKDNMPCQ